MENLLQGLNEPQKNAVKHRDGALLVVAGAGAGKTKVVTHRIANLIASGIHPSRICAVTFTNKAAQEMRDRVHTLLAASGMQSLPYNITESPFIGTFHALAVRIIRENAATLGLRKSFTILDRTDAQTIMRTALKESGADPKQHTPRAMLGFISRHKSELLDVDDFESTREQNQFSDIAARAWRRYRDACRKEHALDFDDLLLTAVTLLQNNEAIRAAYNDMWTHLHIDEYQDTNHAQYSFAQLLSQNNGNICAVGDTDQCLTAGTQITMADGHTKPIEKIRRGEQVLSNHGSADWRAATVSGTFSSPAPKTRIRITTQSGRILTSTPEHTHFAGYRAGLTPQMYFVYLMYKRDFGFRIGVSQMYTNGQKQPASGFAQRCVQEHADCVWILETHDSQNIAREREYVLSLTYRIPTLPFTARGGATGGYVHDQKALERVFASFETEESGRLLLDNYGLSFTSPHHRAQTRGGRRLNIIVTLCGDRRGATPMHRISIAGRSAEDKEQLQQAGFSVRPARRKSENWRFETCNKNYAHILSIVSSLQEIFPDASVIQNARLGNNRMGHHNANSLTLTPAASLKPGMALFGKDGYDIVQSVEKEEGLSRVYDINVENTHNFIANGIVTHNSIYGWRGAKIRNILRFEKDFPNAEIVFLEENYRSSATILEAANTVIKKNEERMDKTLFTQNTAGDPLSLIIAPNEAAEASAVAERAGTLLHEGVSPDAIAVLYRANFQSRALEEAFLAAGIPYRVLGTRFFERQEVKDVISYIRAALNPEQHADIKRAINTPPRGIGQVTVTKLFAGQKESLNARSAAKVDAFYDILARIRAAADEKMPADLIAYVLTESGLEAHLKDQGDEGEERLMNIRELVTLAARYSGPPQEAILRLVEDAALAADQDTLLREKNGGVRLMTVHAAKGLEFDHVFVTGMEQGLFPHESFSGGDTGRERAEEERRLFYVALTRAGTKASLSYAEQRTIFGSRQFSVPSEFLGDIPPALLETERVESDYSNGREWLPSIQ